MVYHQPVLLKETIQHLNPQPNQNFIDCTIGGGGHAEEILKKIGPGGKLIGIDGDKKALAWVGKRLKKYQSHLILFNDNFVNLEKIYEQSGLDQIDGILLDLGLSSFAIKDASRGFSFMVDGPLDMRFNLEFQSLTAKEIVNKWPAANIEKILRQYGEEKFARAIAAEIVKSRKKAPIKSTAQLANIILNIFKNKKRGRVSSNSTPVGLEERSRLTRSRIHPATKTFQALRIAVNNELDVLKKVLPQALKILAPGGKLAVISFHSLEDRIVKQFFKQEARDCICPSEIPICQCQHKIQLKILTKKPVVPSSEEVADNLRSRSAKLRGAEKM